MLYHYEENRVYWAGKYKAFVRDNKDPENRGRIRVFCPQIMGAADSPDCWLGWAEPCFPWLGGMNTGDCGPPLTGEEQRSSFGNEWYGVWIEFEMGHQDFPVWVGTFTIAPKATDDRAHQMGVTGGSGQPGGGILGSPGTGPLNPPTPQAARELRLRAPKGVDVVIGSEKGGYLVLGPSGAHLVGAQVTINGKVQQASSTKKG